MVAMEKLCKKGVLLEKGKIKSFSNDIQDVIKIYMYADNTSVSGFWKNTDNLYKNPFFTPIEFFIGDCIANKLSMPVRNDGDFYIHIIGVIEKIDPSLQVGYAIYDERSNLLYWSCFNDEQEEKWPNITLGQNHLYSKIPKHFLNEGNYKIELIAALFCREWICAPNNNAPNILLKISGGLGESFFLSIKRPGILSPVLQWARKES
jgi:hypothetical protein